MSYAYEGKGALEYYPCRYGKSRLLFRGPRKDLSKPYVAFLGGNETYGRFIQRPFVAQLEQSLDHNTVNFGCMNAGVDVYKNETSILRACSQGQATVIQVMGAQNMSNRFYSVHPRRNDRFICASALMQTIFREVDFTDFSFNRHMLTTLQRISPERFEVVKDELRAAWTARMTSLVKSIASPVILLWLADRTPEQEDQGDDLAGDPLFVTRRMLEDVGAHAAAVVEVPIRRPDAGTDTEGMLFTALEVTAAQAMLGLGAHDAVTKALTGPLQALVQM